MEGTIIGRGGGGLSEQLPDFSVDVAKEVHVGGSTVQTLVLHQELAEQHLRFVFLPHDLELERKKTLTSSCCVTFSTRY